MLSQAVDKLRHCEFLEGLAVLGLAVWKSMCLLQMPELCDYLVAKRWTMTDWKTCKPAQCESNAMNVIVSSVRPFLDPP
jgi:hypothetical protein